MISWLFVICDPCDQLFCRAYGEITQSEYLFALLLDTLARVSVPCFFMISGALLWEEKNQLKKHREETASFFDRTGSMECSVLYLESCFYEDRI